ncbi:hypothetical protein PR202_ga03880 [Eleusine coracana subsp. coracana]|uniref:DUF6598 domain-containing protein n=1 Tax=Eleusine coracana subsp. coracana TaxID=191504 RepID=A0AAV5BQY3_ELECO|nr:hypothetical protein PR202_ga03880 [Eleusine coracana subsp. coracana]
MEAKLGSSDHDNNKRSDPDTTPGDEVYDGGNAKRPCEGDHGHSYGAMKMEMDEYEEEEEDMTPYQPFGFYCKNWIMMCGHKAKFEDPIYYVKVAQITGKLLQWPLDVYGDVADSLLELTGPSRAVLLLDPADFEIFLKVKAKEESEEDTVLCCRVFGCNSIAYKEVQSYAKTKVLSSEHSTIEVSIGEDVVLLDTRGREVSVTKDGEVVLQRRVAVVEEQGNLILGIKATQLDDGSESSTSIEMKMRFCARFHWRSTPYGRVGQLP